MAEHSANLVTRLITDLGNRLAACGTPGINLLRTPDVPAGTFWPGSDTCGRTPTSLA